MVWKITHWQHSAWENGASTSHPTRHKLQSWPVDILIPRYKTAPTVFSLATSTISTPFQDRHLSQHAPISVVVSDHPQPPSESSSTPGKSTTYSPATSTPPLYTLILPTTLNSQPRTLNQFPRLECFAYLICIAHRKSRHHNSGKTKW